MTIHQYRILVIPKLPRFTQPGHPSVNRRCDEINGKFSVTVGPALCYKSSLVKVPVDILD